jgi:predicted nucleotidyltransferase
MVMNEINLYIDQIRELCIENQVASLFAFGSVTKNQLTDKSDLDLLVDIPDKDPISYTDKYYNLKTQLEQLFKRHIDLIESKSIKNPFLKASIDQSKVLIYGK